MPSLFTKRRNSEPTPEVPVALDLQEEMNKMNRELLNAQREQEKCREAAKKAMATNNQVMAKQMLQQSKLHEQRHKQITASIMMLQQKQNQLATVKMAKEQIQVMKQVNQQIGDASTVMDQLQDVMQESQQQNMQIQQMQELMGTHAQMAFDMMDPNGEIDEDIRKLQEEINVENMQKINVPQTDVKPTVVQPKKKLLDDLL